MTDAAATYYNKLGEFASHEAVDHSAGGYVRGDAHTNTVEGYFSIFKRGMKGVYQHCDERHLHRYLAEFDFRFNHYPKHWMTYALAAAIYVNFFAHHWLPDLRIALFAAIALLFWRTRVTFRNWRKDRWMPLLVGWFLVALFIWFAENIATFSHAWIYPSQKFGWTLVSPAKLGAWYLLMYISFALVAAAHGVKE